MPTDAIPKTDAEDLVLFALASTRALGERVAGRLGQALASHEERSFEGGEHKTRPLVEVAGRDVFVIESLEGDAAQSANDKLVRLLFFIGALKDAGAAQVSVVTPYLAYNRKDRRTKPRDPVNSRYIAALFESVGTDRIVALEAHNVSAFENAFRSCRPEHVPAAGVFADYFAALLDGEPVAVVSPDAGGVKRAELFRSQLESRLGRPTGKAIMDKHRSMGVVSGSLFAGDVAGRAAIVIDDLISSGTTMARAVEACRRGGAIRVIAAAAHGLFSGGGGPLFAAGGPDRIVVTDSVPIADRLSTAEREKVDIVSVADLLGDVILRFHRGEAVSDLIPYD